MSYDLVSQRPPRLGLIVLSSDETLEDEARAAIAGTDVSLLHSRIECAPDVTPDNLRQMEARMTATAALLPKDLDAIGYGCTSASVVIGPEAVAARVGAGHAGVPVTNPISAVMAALTHLGARRIAMVTPYAPDVVAPMRAFLKKGGFEVLEEISFGESDDRRVARIAEASTLEAIEKAGQTPGVEAVFTSCTNLRSFGIIDQAERKLGLPVISSNSALMWHTLTLAGVTPAQGPGQLFARIQKDQAVNA